VIGQARSTQRYRIQVPDDEPRLIQRIIELATKYGRYGYRRITALLQREGWQATFRKMPENFYAAHYKYDAILAPLE